MNNLLNMCELYPSRRPTEYYRTPQQRPSTQSRKAEHPTDKLNKFVLTHFDNPRNDNRIQPALTPRMRELRNSYFS
ncbi:uncharacterized protein LOC117779941 [Drosophila innubila]|uniref:uncharacterized protein LOC117779941 n=1 Tax=Drosophila innubila TaxID=198719 RepID=UPI00148BA63B|nr:uncharacterized protein LOC117779941 [Drosophila innubila]